MKLAPPLFVLLACITLFSCNSEAQPTAEIFKEAFVKRLQSLRPDGFDRRTVKIVQVTQGKTNSGTTSYKVTAYIHDYDEGYPPNQYYGQTCVGKMDNWVFTMHKDGSGEWIVQGKFTVTDSDCKTNTSEGVESLPLTDVPGTTYEPGKSKASNNSNSKKEEDKDLLYVGEYAAYGTGGRLMAGMGIILTNDNKYYDLDKKRGGTYSYDKTTATISFQGGFLSGQKGRNVNANGFDLSDTVHYEPYR